MPDLRIQYYEYSILKLKKIQLRILERKNLIKEKIYQKRDTGFLRPLKKDKRLTPNLKLTFKKFFNPFSLVNILNLS